MLDMALFDLVDCCEEVGMVIFRSIASDLLVTNKRSLASLTTSCTPSVVFFGGHRRDVPFSSAFRNSLLPSGNFPKDRNVYSTTTQGSSMSCGNNIKQTISFEDGFNATDS
jgi:hypothetical protein